MCNPVSLLPSSSMVQQVFHNSDSRTIDIQVPLSDLEESFGLQHPGRCSINSDDLNFPDFEWEREDARKRNSASQLSPRHRRIHADSEGSSRGSSPGRGARRGSRGWSPLVHAHTVSSPSHEKQPRNESIGNKPASSSLSRLDDVRRSGSDSLKVPSVAMDTRRSTNDVPVAKKRGLRRSEEVQTVDLE